MYRYINSEIHRYNMLTGIGHFDEYICRLRPVLLNIYIRNFVGVGTYYMTNNIIHIIFLITQIIIRLASDLAFSSDIYSHELISLTLRNILSDSVSSTILCITLS